MLHCATAVSTPQQLSHQQWEMNYVFIEHLSETSLSQSPPDAADVIPKVVMFMNVATDGDLCLHNEPPRGH